MRTIARFATRHTSKPGQTDVFVGVMFKASSDALKPDHVYEIREVLGELMIVDMGEQADPKAWNYDISRVVDCEMHRVIVTKGEGKWTV